MSTGNAFILIPSGSGVNVASLWARPFSYRGGPRESSTVTGGICVHACTRHVGLLERGPWAPSNLVGISVYNSSPSVRSITSSAGMLGIGWAAPTERLLLKPGRAFTRYRRGGRVEEWDFASLGLPSNRGVQ